MSTMGPVFWGQHGTLLFTGIQLGLNINLTSSALPKAFLSLIILIQDASLRCNLSPKIDSIAFSIVPNSVRLGICICCCCLVVKLYLTLYVPMDCSRPGSSVHGESSGKNAGVSCHAFHQWIFPAQRLNPCLISPALGGRFFTTQSLQKPWNPLRTCINSPSSIIRAKKTNKRTKNLLSMPMLSWWCLLSRYLHVIIKLHCIWRCSVDR